METVYVEEPIDAGQPVDQLPVVQDVGAIGGIIRAEIDTQIATARRFPRSEALAKQRALTLATMDVDTASGCFYKLPRDGKMIEGPSIRLAEIFATCWGNMRYGSRVISIDDQFITAQGYAADLQSNNAVSVEIRRRITNKQGKRFKDDMIAVTGNAAGAIARRNALFSIIPGVFVNHVFRECKRVAIGDAKTLVDRRAQLLGYLMQRMGIALERILAVVGKAGIDDIGLSEMETLHGLATAVRDGDVDLDTAFPPVKTESPAPAGNEPAQPESTKPKSLTEKIKSNGAPVKPPEPERPAESVSPQPGQVQPEPAKTAPDAAPVPTSDDLPVEPPNTPDQPEIAPAPAGGDLGESAVPDSFDTYSAFKAAVVEHAKRSGWDIARVESGLDAACVAYPIRTERPSAGKKRREIYDAVVAGRFDWSMGKIKAS